MIEAGSDNGMAATATAPPVTAGRSVGPSDSTLSRPKLRAPISLVLPMFNEAPCVDQTLATALRALEDNFTDFEIVVADDASTDESPALVEKWVARDDRIRLVRLPRNERFGGALRAGLAAARQEYLIYTDFDLQIGLSCLPLLLAEFADADVLTGYSADHDKHANWRAMIISQTYNFLVRTLFNVKLRDINFGLKALRKPVWDQLRLRSRSPFVDAELFVQVSRLGYRIKEVAVPFSLRATGASHIRRFDVIARTLADMAWCWVAPPRLTKTCACETARHQR